MVGPYYSLVEFPGAGAGDSSIAPRLLNRFGILEMHGGATEESCRVIDDGKAQGHSADSANTAAHRPADLDLVVAICRAIAEAFPGEELAGYPSDFKSAYGRVTSDPGQALDLSSPRGMRIVTPRSSSRLLPSCSEVEAHHSISRGMPTFVVVLCVLFSQTLQCIASTMSLRLRF